MLGSSVVLLSYLLVPSANAFSLPFKAINPPPPTISIGSGSKAPSDPDIFNFSNVNDILKFSSDIYTANLTVDSRQFQVQLDTGSSDLWLDTTGVNFTSVQDTGMQSSLTYGDGTVAQGNILIGNTTFGNFSFPQAFISAPGTNATTNNDTGLLGVGPPSLSAISMTLQNSAFNGKTVMENLFAANPSEPNFITFQLSRSEATGTTDGGVFTVGEVESTYSGISSAPKLTVVNPGRWVVLMDGIIVNGNNFTGNSTSSIPSQSPSQTLANLDSGTGLGQVPRSYLDAIYGGVPGAEFQDSQGVYVVPCSAKIQLSFVFGGIAYPVHPIDTVTVAINSGNIICLSGFTAGASSSSEPQDFLLGASFLRNVYSLYDFGSFISGTTAPFVQLLSTTNETAADAEFDALSATRNASITGKGTGGGSPSSGSNGTGGNLGSGAPRTSGMSAVLFATFFGVSAGVLAL